MTFMPDFDPNKHTILTNKEEFPGIWLVQVRNNETNVTFGTRFRLEAQPQADFVLKVFEMNAKSRENRWWVENHVGAEK